MADTGTRPYLRSETRRRQLLAAAGRLFERAGYAGLAMSDLAAEAGVSRRLVYDHFPDLASLHEAYFDDALTRYVAANDQVVAAGEGDPRRAFLGAFEHLLAMPLVDRRAVSLLVTDTTTPGLDRLRDRFRARVEDRWLDAVAAGGDAQRATRITLWVAVAGLFQLVELVHRGETSVDDALALAAAIADHLPAIAANAVPA